MLVADFKHPLFVVYSHWSFLGRQRLEPFFSSVQLFIFVQLESSRSTAKYLHHLAKHSRLQIELLLCEDVPYHALLKFFSAKVHAALLKEISMLSSLGANSFSLPHDLIRTLLSLICYFLTAVRDRKQFRKLRLLKGHQSGVNTSRFTRCKPYEMPFYSSTRRCF